LLFILFYVFVCKCVLPPGDNPIAVNKYIYHTILYIQITEVRHISWWAVSTLSMLKWNYYKSKTKSNNFACSQHWRS